MTSEDRVLIYKLASAVANGIELDVFRKDILRFKVPKDAYTLIVKNLDHFHELIRTPKHKHFLNQFLKENLPKNIGGDQK